MSAMIKKIFSLLSTLLLIALIALAGVILIPQMMGYHEMAVLSGSMEPNIHVGSVVYVKETDPETLNVGDVITYELSADTYVTHRVVSIDTAGDTLVTQGDSNDSDDGNINFSQILGKAEFWLPYLGYISIYIKTPVGIMCVTVLLVLIIFLNFVPMILSSGKAEQDGSRRRPHAGHSGKR